MNKQISVFFPCYNEQDNIERVVKNAVNILSSITDFFEVIIVDDGSGDNTEGVADKLVKEDERVRYIKHAHNLGYGSALRTGFRNSRYELICFTDGDGQFNLEEIKTMLPFIGDADAVIGYRKDRQDPFYRLLNAKIYGFVIWLFFGLNVKDIDCGFKLFKKTVIDELDIESCGALASAELLIKIKSKGYQIKQIEVKHFPRLLGEQTGANVRVIFKAGIELMKFFPKLFKIRLDACFKKSKNR